MNLKSIWIETTNRCNLSCLTCGSDKGNKDISLDIVKKISDQCFLELEEVNLTGAGEPTVTKYFYEMCSLVLEKYQKKLLIITNGMILNKNLNLLELLVKKNTHLVISVDGIEHNYERIRRGANWNSLLELLDKIKLMRNENISFVLGINFVLNKDNRFDLVEIIKKAGMEWKADYLCVIMMQPWYKNTEFYKNASPTYVKEDINLILHKAKKLADNVGLKIILPPKFNLKSEKKFSNGPAELLRTVMKQFRSIKWLVRNTPIKYLYAVPAICYLKYPKLYRFIYDVIGFPKVSCNVPFERLSFKINGEITPCCALQNYIIGSINNESITSIMRGSAYLTMLDNMFKCYLPIECLRCQLPMGIYKGNPDFK